MEQDRMKEMVEIFHEFKSIEGAFKAHMHHHFKELGLTGPQGMLVMTIKQHGKLKISELGEELGLSNSTISGLVDRLEAIDCVHRIRSKEDRRVVYVTLTDKMEAAIHQHKDGVKQLVKSVIAKASQDEFEAIMVGLSTLSRLMREITEGDR